MWSRVIVGVLLGVASGVSAQETLLFDVNAYNPVPSPDGKLIAYDVTGRDLNGSVGFGRSHLLSQVEVCDLSGKTRWNPKVDGFLGEWLPDSSAIGTYRDWHFALAGPTGARESGSIPDQFSDHLPPPAERATYLPKFGAFVWVEREDVGTSLERTVLQTNNGRIATLDTKIPTAALIVPSPDQRYLAVGGSGLWVYDTEMLTWTNLGNLTIHPDSGWDYVKPSWNPWFSDSRHLAFFSGTDLYIASPDGKARRKLLEAANAGLAIPSPDGTLVAFIRSIPRPMKGRPDLSFWGGSSIWVVPSGGGKAVPISKPSDDETYDLRWLSNTSVVFDRVGEGLFNEGARIWIAPVAMQ
jgi:hypothetical protein